MKNCRICGDDTEIVFNIDFKATPICEECATAIFSQQAKWYVETFQTLKDKISDLEDDLLFSY